jgi:hypothetical protein
VTKTKMLSAVLILSAAVATPVFAQDASGVAPHPARAHDRNYRGTYNQVNGPSYDVTPVTRDGVSAREVRDPTRPGGEDPSFNPPS